MKEVNEAVEVETTQGVDDLELQGRGETKAIQAVDEVPYTEEELEELAKQDAEVESILSSMGLTDAEPTAGKIAIDSNYYTEQMNIVNEIRQTAGVICNRLMMAVLGEFKLELKTVGIEHETLIPEVYNRTFITYAQKFFDDNLPKFIESTEGSDITRVSFEHAVSILSHVVGFSIDEDLVRFDLITVQVLHVMQKQFHDSMQKQQMETTTDAAEQPVVVEEIQD